MKRAGENLPLFPVLHGLPAEQVSATARNSRRSKPAFGYWPLAKRQ